VRGAATRSRQQAALSAEQLTIAWQAASLLLDYPSEELLDHVALVRSASRELPDRLGDPLRGFADHVERTPLADLQAGYVETFDTRRRCNLFLTYFAHGDTR
jgi:nitrate reductase delta subunit